MTGMKEGAGDDPFAEDPADEPDESPVQQRQAPAESGSPGQQREYPYMLTRDTVKEGRTNEAVFFLRDEFAEYEDEVHDAVEEIVDDDVYLTDLREAIVATADPEAIADQLQEWGQGVK